MSDHDREDPKGLQFVPFSSALDHGFWHKLYQKKLDEYKLEDASVDIRAYYSNGQSSGLPPIANIDYTSFDGIDIPPDTFPLKGILINTNTLEEFKTKDKKLLLQAFGKKIWDDILNGEAIKDPSLLQRILCFTFADLVKYHYYYWIAFPAFLYPEVVCHNVRNINEYFSENQIKQLLQGYDAFSEIDRMYFVIHVQNNGSIRILKLSAYDSGDIDSGKIILGFSDPSTVETYAGWPLRNFLSLVAMKWCKNGFTWDVVCLRDRIKDNSRFCSHSIVLTVEIKDKVFPNGISAYPKTVGWEKNQNRLLPRKVDMSSNMDPFKLANSAFDFNLKLMRWRALPELELDYLSSTKCLLLGAGTLGCNVARSLLGWGVKNITLVDNARVSFSNPVRQTLFQFEDCLNGGRPKAEAACDALKRIFPGVNAVGKMLSIPMPGHFVSRSDCGSVRSDIQELENLINYHDVIFLLMDTNESRWLPTVISAAKQKIVLNAALGFETFRVMRHAFRATEPSSLIPPDLLQQNDYLEMICGQELGCFFCYNIFAPGDSTKYHTLDQQCTATRPGVSSIAAALVVELMASILHHPQRGAASAAAEVKSKEYINDATKYLKCKEYRRRLEDFSCMKSPLGIIPHIMDGHLNSFHIDINVTRADDCCTACSEKVIDAYRQDGFDFLLEAFNDYRYLEKLTGLSDRYNNVDSDDGNMTSSTLTPCYFHSKLVPAETARWMQLQKNLKEYFANNELGSEEEKERLKHQHLQMIHFFLMGLVYESVIKDFPKSTKSCKDGILFHRTFCLYKKVMTMTSLAEKQKLNNKIFRNFYVLTNISNQVTCNITNKRKKSKKHKTKSPVPNPKKTEKPLFTPVKSSSVEKTTSKNIRKKTDQSKPRTGPVQLPVIEDKKISLPKYKVLQIQITSEGKWRTISKELDKVKVNFTAKTSVEKVIIFPATLSDYKIITSFCSSNNITYETLMDTEQPISFVLKGLELNSSSEDIILSLQQRNFEVLKVQQLCRWRDGSKLPIWRVDMPCIPTSHKILELKELDHLKIKVDTFRHTQWQCFLQCCWCMQWNHHSSESLALSRSSTI